MGQDDTDTNEVSHAALATAILSRDVGTWDADLEIRTHPGAQPQYQKGKAVRAMVGDRWLVVDVKMYSGFSGHGVYGWDPFAQRYTGIWVDSVSAAIARATGTYDLARGEMRYDVEVEHAGRKVRYREVTRAVDEDVQVYSHFVPLPGGGEHEMMTITYRRAAG